MTPALRLLERWLPAPFAQICLSLIYALCIVAILILIGYDDAKQILYLDIQ